MAQFLGFQIYHFTGKLPQQIETQFVASDDVNFLKSPLRDSISLFTAVIDVNVKPLEQSGYETQKNTLIFRRFFTNSLLEQIYIAVPIEALSFARDETHRNYFKRMNEDAKEKLKNVFGVHYEAQNFKFISSLVWVLEDEKEFFDNKFSYDLISNFIAHSYKIGKEDYIALDNYLFTVDNGGVGIICERKIDYSIINRLLFILMLAKAYLASLESISLGTTDPLDKSQSFFEEAEKIENKLDDYHRFLIRYYYNNPILVDVNKTFYVYEKLKKVLRLREQYDETKEQIRILAEIARAKRRQIAEMTDSNIKSENQDLQLLLQKNSHNIIKLTVISGANLLVLIFIFIVLLFS